MQRWEYFRLVPYRDGDGWHFDFAGRRHDHASIDDAHPSSARTGGSW